MRLAHDRFRVVTGGGMGMRDKKIVRRRAARGRLGAAVRRHERLDDDRAVGAAGARHPRGVTADDVSHAGFPFLTSPTVEINGVRTLASRISYVGELGWEIYVPIEQGLRVWDALWESGRPHGLVPVGIGATRSRRGSRRATGRTATSSSSTSTWSRPAWPAPTVKDADFVGRAAYLAQRSKPPPAVLCTLTVDDPTSKSGVKRYMLGREPILSSDGAPLIDAKGPPVVRDVGRLGPVRRQAPADVVPAARRRQGRAGSLLVEYLGEQYPVTVAVAGSTPAVRPRQHASAIRS